MDPKKRKKVRDCFQIYSTSSDSNFFQVRHQIMSLLDETDDTHHIVDNDDSCSSPSAHSPTGEHDEDCAVEPTANEIPTA